MRNKNKGFSRWTNSGSPKQSEKLIKKMWQEYSEAIFSSMPGGVSEIQRKETRRAFYAAASGMLALMADIASSESEQEAANKLESMHKECVEFAEMVEKGVF